MEKKKKKKQPMSEWERQHQDTPVATWCSPEGRLSLVICVAQHGSKGFPQPVSGMPLC